MREIVKKVVEYLIERGFHVKFLREDLVTASQGKLKVNVWFSDKDYLEWYDPLNVIDEFQLQDSNALVIVAPRAYSIADEVLHSIERARYWYDLFINVKVYSVDTAVLDKALEEAVNSILTNFVDLSANVVLTEDLCPRCKSTMYVMYINTFFSRILKCQVIEKVYRCPNCSLKIHRLEDRYRCLR